MIQTCTYRQTAKYYSWQTNPVYKIDAGSSRGSNLIQLGVLMYKVRDVSNVHTNFVAAVW